MDINLLSQNLLIILGILLGSAAMLIVSAVIFGRPRRKKEQQREIRVRKTYPFILLGCILTAIISQQTVHLCFPTDKLPSNMWLMFLPATISLGLVIFALLHEIRWLKWLSASVVLVSFIFSLLIINNYYSFYPTLYSIFGNDSGHLLAAQTTDIQFLSAKVSSRTIEDRLYGKGLSTIGQVHSQVIPGSESNFTPRTAWVYEPAIASYQSNVKLPVIVLLSGYPGLTYNWLGGGLKRTMDEFAKQHHGITPMVFMVDDTGSVANDTECVNSPRGNVETYLSVDVPAYIKSHYQVDTDASNWAIGGLSMGGMCSAMLALRHPDVYSHFLDFSGEIGPETGSWSETKQALFGGSTSELKEHQPLYLLKTRSRDYKKMGAFLAVGKGDSKDLIKSMTTLDSSAKADGIVTVYEQVGGQHSWQAWEQGFKDALPWISNRLGATACAVNCTSGS